MLDSMSCSSTSYSITVLQYGIFNTCDYVFVPLARFLRLRCSVFHLTISKLTPRLNSFQGCELSTDWFWVKKLSTVDEGQLLAPLLYYTTEVCAYNVSILFFFYFSHTTVWMTFLLFYFFLSISHFLLLYSAILRLLFWAQCGTSAKIERASLDGHDRKALVIYRIRHPVALSLGKFSPSHSVSVT